MAPGQPTKYDPKYCEMIVEHMKDGNSLNSFAVKIGVHKDTIYQWIKVFPEFSDSYKIAMQACQDWWERIAKQHLITHSSKEEGSTNFNNTIWIFNMKNRFGWRDNFDLNVTGQLAHEHTHQTLEQKNENMKKLQAEKLKLEAAVFDAEIIEEKK